MVKSNTTSITPAQHAINHRHGGTDPLTGDVRIDPIGFETMHEVHGSRALGTNYQNLTGNPMFVSVGLFVTGRPFEVTAYVKASSPADSQVFIVDEDTADDYRSVTFMVPNNWYYRVAVTGGTGTKTHWTETY